MSNLYQNLARYFSDEFATTEDVKKILHKLKHLKKAISHLERDLERENDELRRDNQELNIKLNALTARVLALETLPARVLTLETGLGLPADEVGPSAFGLIYTLRADLGLPADVAGTGTAFARIKQLEA